MNRGALVNFCTEAVDLYKEAMVSKSAKTYSCDLDLIADRYYSTLSSILNKFRTPRVEFLDEDFLRGALRVLNTFAIETFRHCLNEDSDLTVAIEELVDHFIATL